MRLRKVLRKIHRWVGLLSAFWLLQLAITGLLLQHADDFKLTQTYVSSHTMLKWFGYGTRQQIWQEQDATLYQIDDVVGFNDQQVTISGVLVGAAVLPVIGGDQQWVVATKNALYWFNQQGETVQKFDDFDGLPTPVTALVNETSSLYIQAVNQWYQLQDSGGFLPTTGNFSAPTQFRPMSSTEQDQYYATALQGKLSYDKVLHGIHAGIQGSKWLNTLSALALMYLCISGIYLFFKQPKRKR